MNQAASHAVSREEFQELYKAFFYKGGRGKEVINKTKDNFRQGHLPLGEGQVQGSSPTSDLPALIRDSRMVSWQRLKG